MKFNNADRKQRDFYLLLMFIAYVSTLTFSVFYYFHGVYILAYNGFFCFGLFVMYGILSFYLAHRVLLFRLSIFTAFYAFYFQVYFTGGLLSPSMSELIVPPIIAFFYRPIKDRYYFMILAALGAISMWPLTSMGFTENRLPPECQMPNSLLITLFVFTIIGLYAYLFRHTLAKKNKLLRQSLSELQLATQKLVQSEKMATLGMMSAGVAHEINNPLNFIRGGIDMLSKHLEKSPEAQPFLDAVDTGVTRATSIVNSLSHFSKESPSPNEICDIHDIIESCLTMIHHKLQFKVEVVKKYGDPTHMKFSGHEGQLHQAIMNIISNAEQAIENEKGMITIETSATEEIIRISITDTGVGISEENLKRIKDPFFTTRPAGQGSGLGLSIAFNIIEEHKGKIDIISKPAIGTQINILLHKRLDNE